MHNRKSRYRHEVHLNINVRGLPISPTLAINETSKRLHKEGKTVYRLGLGQSPFPVPEPVIEALRCNAGQKDYLSVRGLEALRQAIADYYQRRQELQFSWQNILIGPGSKELMFLLQMVYYGDLLIPLPSWVSYAPQAHIVGRPVRWIKTAADNNWLITPEALETICLADPTKPRVLVLNYPNNPSGMGYPKSTLKRLAAVARKYHVILLSDEIYGELSFYQKHTSIARYYPEGTIISSGLSKWCGAGGWRLGFFAFPEQLSWLLEGMAVVASETYTSTSAPIQHAAVSAFNGGDWLESYLNNARSILKGLSERITANLRQAGVVVQRAEGGFYLFPDFRPLMDKLAMAGINSSDTLCARLLEETGVALLPGSAFGLSPELLLARLAFVDFDGEQALAALYQQGANESVTDAFLENYCEPVLTATDRLADWLTSR